MSADGRRRPTKTSRGARWCARSARYVRVAPRKARLVADQMRGLPVDEARDAAATSRPAAPPRDIAKLLDSAAANAENNHDLIADDLRITEISVDEGPTLKRWRARAPRPRDPDRQAHQPHQRRPHPDPRTRGPGPDGTEDSPRGLPRRLHPRLEVELVQRARLRRLPARGHRDPRAHREQARPRRPLRHQDRQAARRGHRRHPHGPPGHRDRQVRLRGRRAAPRAAQDHRQAGEGQHPRDQAPRARRQAGRPVDRRAAPEPRRLPPRDEARADLGDALRRQGRQGPGLRPPRRRRDGAHRGLLRRPRPAAHAARRHRLRLRRGADDHRPDRRQVLDQQGRGHARGLRGTGDERGARPAAASPAGSAAAASARRRGPRGRDGSAAAAAGPERRPRSGRRGGR